MYVGALPFPHMWNLHFYQIRCVEMAKRHIFPLMENISDNAHIKLIWLLEYITTNWSFQGKLNNLYII